MALFLLESGADPDKISLAGRSAGEIAKRRKLEVVCKEMRTRRGIR
jgi:hypothetical protein